MTDVLKIIQNPTLTYDQKVVALARLAENSDTTSLPKAPCHLAALEVGAICNLHEGNVPYRPRYIIPDYRLLFEKGSKTLGITKPTDLWEATNALLIMYHHVPSITTFPVFLGNLDELLEPYVLEMDEKEAKKCLRLFLHHIDKTLTDSFVHADIGPKASVTGRLIMELSQEMQLAIPNITLKYDPEVTPSDFAKLAIETMLVVAKPSFANHQMFVKEWGEDYAIASCYNGLLVGGGGYTLHRLCLGTVAKQAKDIDDFFTNVLPFYAYLLWEIIEDRVCFIVEESRFFETNFLVTEGFVKQERFTGMYGIVGLAECVNNLLGITDPLKGYGYNEEANLLAERVMDVISDVVESNESKYCAATNHRFRLHAQVGIDTDGRENSPGARIPIGSEPLLHEQLNHSCRYHKYFATGVGDVFKFDDSWNKSPEALLDIISGAMKKDYRYFSGYNADNDVVRVTGYLVKKSEIDKLDNQTTSLNHATVFGQGARDGADALDRRVHDEGSRK